MNKKINGLEVLNSLLGGWSPGHLALVNSLKYDSVKSELVLVGASQKRLESWPDFDRGFDKIELVFQGVTNLHLNGFGSGVEQLMGFGIISPDVDGGFFEIEDYEDGKIGFLCDAVSVRLIES